MYWAQSAVEDLQQLSSRQSRLALRLVLGVRQFGSGARADLKKLEGSSRWRLRVGEWRVFLSLEDERAYIHGFSDRQDALAPSRHDSCISIRAVVMCC